MSCSLSSLLGLADGKGLVAMGYGKGVALGSVEVGLDHLANEFGERSAGGPPKDTLGFAGISEQGLDFGGTEVARVDCHNDVAARVQRLLVDATSLPCEIEFPHLGAAADELPDGVLFAGGDDELLRPVFMWH